MPDNFSVHFLSRMDWYFSKAFEGWRVMVFPKIVEWVS
jgi:hypothetical protein